MGLTHLQTYYQYKKAKHFKDEQCASRILDAKTPAKAISIAYQIKDFDEAMWMPVAKQTMLTGCSMKFSTPTSGFHPHGKEKCTGRNPVYDL